MKTVPLSAVQTLLDYTGLSVHEVSRVTLEYGALTAEVYDTVTHTMYTSEFPVHNDLDPEEF